MPKRKKSNLCRIRKRYRSSKTKCSEEGSSHVVDVDEVTKYTIVSDGQNGVPILDRTLKMSSNNKTPLSHVLDVNHEKVTVCDSTYDVLSDDEVDSLDALGLPVALTALQLSVLTKRIRDAYHEDVVVCAVCDEFCVFSESISVEAVNLPPCFFDVLVPPSGKTGKGEASLLPDALLDQYNVGHLFPHDFRFRHVLLSPRGIECHDSSCIDVSSCFCVPSLRVCLRGKSQSCYKSIWVSQCIPKLSIANGNYIGLLPENLRKLTYGTLCCVRPVQSFGRLTTFHGSHSVAGGVRLTGHMYSSRLDTQLVRSKLPILPVDHPVRVLVLSPFASESRTFACAKFASTKDEYVIQPDSIKELLSFWKRVGNKFMVDVEVDEGVLSALPHNDVSSDVYLVDFLSESIVEAANVADVETSLLRSSSESAEFVLVSSTVTVGSTHSSDKSSFSKVSDLLCPTIPPTSAENVKSNCSSQTYCVRPEQKFVSESHPGYFELHFPDKFPFGRGGPNEPRKVPISLEVMFSHLLNLSGRQFQSPDFLFPVSDFLDRKHVATGCFLIGRVPSRCVSSSDVLPSKSVAYGRISSEDLQLAGKYKERCAVAASKGLRLPKAPVSLTLASQNFFRDIELATKPMQHSQAAAISNRQDVYAAHYSNGKATIWLTISPDDTKQFRITWYALLPSQSAPYRDQVPLGNFRFDVLAKHPVAAALYFERVVRIVIRLVIGWDEVEKKPFKNGGLFGIAKGWLRVVEEQSRLTLHAHFLIWIVGHGDIERQISNAFGDLESRFMSAMQENDKGYKSDLTDCDVIIPCDQSKSPLVVVTPPHPSSLKSEVVPVGQAVQQILDRVKSSVQTFVLGEVLLPAEETDIALTCCKPMCGGKMVVRSQEMLAAQRRKHRAGDEEIHSLKCDRCQRTSTVSGQLENALEHGFQRCFNNSRPNDKEVTNLIWKSLSAAPPTCCPTLYDRWLLELAAVHVAVNVHDWNHRGSCFKNGKSICRYKIPKDECSECVVCLIRQSASYLEERVSPAMDDSTLQLLITIKKGAAYLFVTDCNRSLLEVFNCNNCVRYVENQKISMYCGGYSSKYCNDNEKVVAEVLRSIQAYIEKVAVMEKEKLSVLSSITNAEGKCTVDCFPKARSESSIGFGRLLSAARSATNGDSVGAPLCAFAARGNKIFAMSHSTSNVPLAQAIAFLNGDPISVTISRKGSVFATIYDYVYRNGTECFENMNFWNFVSCQTTKKLGKSRVTIPSRGSVEPGLNLEDSDGEPGDVVDFSGSVSPYMKGHPLHGSHGHVRRAQKTWPKYIGKRLPDLRDLSSVSALSEEEKQESRDTYAQGVLVLFHPFRILSDIYDAESSWWESYQKRKSFLESNDSTRTTLRNFQNFYESFCRSSVCDGVEEDESTGFDSFDVDENVVDLSHLDEELVSGHFPVDVAFPLAMDPFVARIMEFSDCPLSLSVESGVEYLRNEDCVVAMRKIKAASVAGGFMLPGRRAELLCSTDLDSVAPHELINKETRSDFIPLGTRIQLLEDIVSALEFSSANALFAGAGLPLHLECNRPTLKDHADDWSLHGKQKKAFFLCGAGLLQCLSRQTIDEGHLENDFQVNEISASVERKLCEILPQDGQVIMFVSGSGGTGKSRVIQSVVDYARRWCTLPSVVVCASSGAAAVLVGGCTIHTALGIRISLKPPLPSSDQILAWSEVYLLIIDEFSMVTPALFDLLDSRLRLMKNRPHIRFGGIHLVLIGDFYQLPPVGSCIYKIPSMRDATWESNPNACVRGRDLWQHCLSDVIILDKNYRQTDKAWSESLLRWRVNQPLLADIEAVNSRFMDSSQVDPLLPPCGTIAVTPDNHSREEGLRQCEKNLLSKLLPIVAGDLNWRERGVLLVESSLCATGSKHISPLQEKSIREMNSKQLGCIGNLLCIISSSYMVGSNSDVGKGVANGTLCCLKDVILSSDSCIRVVNILGNEVHAVYSKDVICLVFKHVLEGWKDRNLFKNFPTGSFPVAALTNRIFVYLSGKTEKTLIRVSQFPCVLSLVVTGHKVQGKTMDNVVLGSISSTHQYGSTGWLYVVLSRVKKITGLFSLVKLSCDVAKYKPRLDVLKEMIRLEKIEKITLCRLSGLDDML